jgi:CheY-like chemotaxis protein
MTRKKLLLVDSDRKLLKELARRCESLGFDTHTAIDAVGAVTLLEKHKPHLICLDDQLPGGSGMRLAEMVVESPDDVSCPVVILLGSDDPKAPRRPREMCVYHVRKRPKLWKYLEPVIQELVVVEPTRHQAIPDSGSEISDCDSQSV